MDKQPLTPRQKQIFEYIVWFRETNGIAPTVREIGDNFEIHSPNGVICHLKALHRKGWIERISGGVSRGIAIAGEQVKRDYRGVLRRLVDSIGLDGKADAKILQEARELVL